MVQQYEILGETVVDVFPEILSGWPEVSKEVLDFDLQSDETDEHLLLGAAPNPLGNAIVYCTETHVTFDANMLDALYTASVAPERQEQDKGACGIVKVGFAVDSGDYEDDQYAD